MKNKIQNLFFKYKEQILYLIFGVLTTLANILVYAIMTDIFNFNYMFANICAWFFSVMFAYITNRKYVFESPNMGILEEMIKFFTSRVFTGILDMILMFVMVTNLYINDTIIKILVNVIVIVLNYILSKKLVFKR